MFLTMVSGVWALGLQEISASPSSFSATGSLVTARYNHAQTLLPNNKVLVVGGADSSGNALASAEIYDPNTKIWSATGSLAVARVGHTATLLANGMILVAGGQNQSGYLASTELYDPATGVWTNTGNLSTPRAAHTSTLLSSGKVLVTGGANATGTQKSAEAYNPATGTWASGGNLFAARQRHTATLVVDTFSPSNPTTRLLLAGGRNESGPLNSCEAWDINANGLGNSASLPTAAPRVGHTATLLPNGLVLLTGGSNSGGFVAMSELYDPTFGHTTISDTAV